MGIIATLIATALCVVVYVRMGKREGRKQTAIPVRRGVLAVFLAAPILMMTLCGCGRQKDTAETAEPAATPAPVEATEPAATPAPVEATEPAAAPETPIRAERQNGERFEDVIIIEGMEETVHYEHIRNEAIGIEMDYDYEKFVRSSESGRERFTSVWDDPKNPENFLELIRTKESADVVAAFVRQKLSQQYDLIEDTRELSRAGACIFIEAAVVKGTNNMADQLQEVFIIPTADGCIIATEQMAVEASEGFGRRFSYMLNTLTVIQ